MNGRVLSNPPIAIDFWNIQSCSEVKMFFLTHLHSDHTRGLTSSWSRPIFCSALTKKLLVHTLKIAEKYIHEIELNKPYNVQIRAETGENMKVTLIDANHCPGAVMFHFEGSFGQILYTGDFRYKESISQELTGIIPHLSIDHLFLDNTFCSQNNNIPPREQAIEEVISIIESLPSHRILLALYTIGKEYLLEEISSRLKTNICVSPCRLKILNIIKCSGNYVTKEDEARIRVVSRRNLTKQLDASDDLTPTKAIIPSGFVFPCDQKDPRIHCVLLSDHSSYEELESFVKFIRPYKITCIVKNSRGVENDFKHYLRPNKTNYTEAKLNNADKSQTFISMPKHHVSKDNLSKPKKRKMSERHGIEYSSSEEFMSECKNDNLDETKKLSGSQNGSYITTTAVGYFSSSHEKLKTKRKVKSIQCSMCNNRFPVSELIYNRNKGKTHGSGLCSRCDVAVSQAAERAHVMKTKSPD